MTEIPTIYSGNVPVRFQGQNYIWLKEADGTGALAYLDHIDGDGHVKEEHVFSDSFAHVGQDGMIRRYLEVIGSRDDLVIG